MPYVTLRYERAKLYEEVWIEAVTTVAKRYGISDVALRKICRKLAVPLPPGGFRLRTFEDVELQLWTDHGSHAELGELGDNTLEHIARALR